MSTQENIALIARIFEEVWNQGHLDRIDHYMSPNYVDHEIGVSPVGPVASSTANPQDRLAEEKAKVRIYRAAFPDLHFMIDDQMAMGDQVVIRWTVSGTLLGPLGHIPPTGKKASVQGVNIDRVENGKVVEGWSFFNMLSVLQQVGALPTPQPAKA